MKLLVADDEMTIRRGLLSLPWNTIGIDEVFEAENGLAAMEILRSHRVDIMISDVRMPGMTGLELAEYVKEYDLDTAVILLTGFSDFEYAQQAIRSGAEAASSERDSGYGGKGYKKAGEAPLSGIGGA